MNATSAIKLRHVSRLSNSMVVGGCNHGHLSTDPLCEIANHTELTILSFTMTTGTGHHPHNKMRLSAGMSITRLITNVI